MYSLQLSESLVAAQIDDIVREITISSIRSHFPKIDLSLMVSSFGQKAK